MSVHTAIRRGEVFFADLHGGVGYEQNGERPVVVLQNDMGNRYSPTVIVAPLTSSRTKSRCRHTSGAVRTSRPVEKFLHSARADSRDRQNALISLSVQPECGNDGPGRSGCGDQSGTDAVKNFSVKYEKPRVKSDN